MNDQLDSVVARQLPQDDTVAKIVYNEHRWAPDRSGKTKNLFVNTNEDNIIGCWKWWSIHNINIHKVGNRDGISIFKGNISLQLILFQSAKHRWVH